MAKRWPPTLGILGYDGGVRPAIALATNHRLIHQLSNDDFTSGGPIRFVYGACCYDDGGCANTTRSTCHGHYQGDYTDCGGIDCTGGGTGTSGACCVGNSCTITTPGECGGTYLGDDTTCDECPIVPDGACCPSPTSACIITTFEECPGLYLGDFIDCPIGEDVCSHAYCGPDNYWCACPPHLDFTPTPRCCPNISTCRTCFLFVYFCCCCVDNPPFGEVCD